MPFFKLESTSYDRYANSTMLQPNEWIAHGRLVRLIITRVLPQPQQKNINSVSC